MSAHLKQKLRLRLPMKMTFNSIAMVITKAREASGLSQSELAAKIGYKNGQFISNVERGLCSIPKKHIDEVAKALAIEPDSIKSAMVFDLARSLGLKITGLQFDIEQILQLDAQLESWGLPKKVPR